MEQEIWKDIEGYEGLYQVSNLGRVKSLGRKTVGNRKHAMTVKGSILKPCNTSNGYLCVNLHNDGIQKTYMIHRLVASAFITNQHKLPMVNHRNEIKTDNRVENLEWCDSKYNNNYGTTKERRIVKVSKPIICIELNTVFSNAREAEKLTGTCNADVCRCCKGKRQTAGGYHWKYIEKEAI